MQEHLIPAITATTLVSASKARWHCIHHLHISVNQHHIHNIHNHLHTLHQCIPSTTSLYFHHHLLIPSAYHQRHLPSPSPSPSSHNISIPPTRSSITICTCIHFHSIASPTTYTPDCISTSYIVYIVHHHLHLHTPSLHTISNSIYPQLHFIASSCTPPAYLSTITSFVASYNSKPAASPPSFCHHQPTVHIIAATVPSSTVYHSIQHSFLHSLFVGLHRLVSLLYFVLLSMNSSS